VDGYESERGVKSNSMGKGKEGANYPKLLYPRVFQQASKHLSTPPSISSVSKLEEGCEWGCSVEITSPSLISVHRGLEHTEACSPLATCTHPWNG